MGRRQETEHSDAGCRLETLAEAGNCRVDRCSHGWVHVTIGGVSLRLHPCQCTQLASALGHAMQQLGEEPFSTDRILS